MYFIKQKVGKSTFLQYVTVLSLLLLPEFANAARLKGRIVDVFKHPIPGAVIKYDSGQVKSDNDGFFEIDSETGKEQIAVSAEGFLFCEFELLDENSISVLVMEKMDAFDLVLPNRSANASRFNSPYAMLSFEKLSEGAADNVSKLLSGRLPGVTVASGNAAPDLFSGSVQIRGGAPLIMVDGRIGVAYEDLSIDEIEKITVLKDAAAAAIYGIKGGRGIIHITTKRGMVSPAKVSFRSDVSYNQFLRLPEPVDAYTHAVYYNMAYRNSGNTSDFYQSDDLALYQNGTSPLTHPDVDWKNDLLKKGYWRSYNHLSIKGGTKSVRYYIGMGYENRSTIFNYDENHNYNNKSGVNIYQLTSNLDFTPWEYADIAFNASGWYTEKNYSGAIGSTSDIYSDLMKIPSDEFPKYYDAKISYVDQNGDNVTGYENRIVSGNNVNSNPWAHLNRAGYSLQTIFRGSAQVTYKQELPFIINGLSFKGDVYYHIGVTENLDRTVPYANYELMEDGTLYKRGNEGTMSNILKPNYTNRRFVYNLSLKYTRNFGKHEVSSVLFWNRYQNNTPAAVPDRDESLSFYAGYGYGDRYSLDMSIAYGGDYKMPLGDKYRLYPSLSAGWTVSNEKFMRNCRDIVSFLKIRASYGEASAGGASAFAYLENLKRQGSAYYTGNNMAGVNGLYLEKIANDSLVNGRLKSTSVGVDLKLFRNSLSLSADLYSIRENGVAITPDASYSQIFGWTNIPKLNLGSNVTRGMELSAEYAGNAGNVSYSIGAVFSSFDKIVLENDEPDNLPYEWMYHKGHSANATYGYVAGGIIRSQEELDQLEAVPAFGIPKVGDIWYVDLNKDGKIDKYDIKDLGYGSTPRINYGFWFDLSFKGFDMSVLFQGASKVNKILGGIYRNPFSGNSTILESQLDTFSNENLDAEYPAYYTTASPNNNQTSTFWMRDASYIRLKSLTLGYSLPVKQFNLRFFASGFNILTFDKLGFIDPETSFSGDEIPAPRTFSFGFNITF